MIAKARAKLDEITSVSETHKASQFNRDRSVQGFGGAVLKKAPKDPQ